MLDLKKIRETPDAVKEGLVARGADPAKFHVGLGQDRMAIPPPDQDIVTLAANAALARWRASGRLDALLDRWLPARPK